MHFGRVALPPRNRVAAALLSLLLLAPATARARAVPFEGSATIADPASAASATHAADVDGDGDLDVLSAAAGLDRIAWHENVGGTGSGWTLRIITSSADGASSVHAADVDGDGDLDVLSASAADAGIRWYENLTGAGTAWVARTVSSTASGASSVYAADVDGDGVVDVLSASATDGQIRWYENTAGNGTNWVARAISAAAPGASCVRAADLDSDGDVDALATSATDGQVRWYENTAGTGAAWTPRQVAAAPGASSVEAADVDRDGDLDAFASSAGDGRVAWHENTNGLGTAWTPHTISIADTGAASVFFADVDADGDLDSIGAAPGADAVVWHDNTAGNGTAWTERSIAALADVAAVLAADLDRDGDADVVAVSPTLSRVVWYRNQSLHRNAAYPTRNVMSSTTESYTLAIADLDSDADPDVIAGAFAGNEVLWFRNQASGTSWTALSIAAGVTGVTSVAPGDLDGDGDPDVVSAAFVGNSLRWHENANGLGTAWVARTIATVPGAISVAVGDADGDGDADVLVGAAEYHEVRWYLNANGLGTAWTERIVTTQAVFVQAVGAADVDGDGDLDALVGSTAPNEIAWYENVVGDASAWTAYSIANSALYALAVQARDVDRDGDLDVLSASTSPTELAWHENLFGDGSAWVERVVGDAWLFGLAIHGADLDVDGDLDALGMRLTPTGGLLTWQENTEGDGSNFAARAILQPSPETYALTAGDIDRDGDLDAVAASTEDSTIAWYPNLGGQVSLAAANTAGQKQSDGKRDDFLSLSVAHLGRSGDRDAELASLSLLLESAPGVPLSTAQANLLVNELRVYRDDGSGAFEQARDTPVVTLTGLSLTAGVQNLTLPDGDPLARVAFGPAPRFFVTARFTGNASAQNPNRLRMTFAGVVAAEEVLSDSPVVLALGPSASSNAVLATNDNDSDGLANAVDEDDDNDGITDAMEAGFGLESLLTDTDGDGIGDLYELQNPALDPLDPDTDSDGVADGVDTCPSLFAPQLDSDADTNGDACDQCPLELDLCQEDGDYDGRGDTCDVCPHVVDPDQEDTDADGWGDACDNCRLDPNPTQLDSLDNGVGDACRPVELRVLAGAAGALEAWIDCGAWSVSRAGIALVLPIGAEALTAFDPVVDGGTSVALGPGPAAPPGARTDTLYLDIRGAGGGTLCLPGTPAVRLATITPTGGPFSLARTAFTREGLAALGLALASQPGGAVVPIEDLRLRTLPSLVQARLILVPRPGDVTATRFALLLDSTLSIRRVTAAAVGDANVLPAELSFGGCLLPAGANQQRSCMGALALGYGVDPSTSFTLGPSAGLARPGTLFPNLLGRLPVGAPQLALNVPGVVGWLGDLTLANAPTGVFPPIFFDGVTSIPGIASALETTSGSAIFGDNVEVLVSPGAALDYDADGIPDEADNCRFAANATQIDNGGLPSPGDPVGVRADGTGDACECGDLDGDGRSLASDLLLVKLAVLAGTNPPACSVMNGTSCNVLDAAVLARAQSNLAPAIQPACAAAVRSGGSPLAALRSDLVCRAPSPGLARPGSG